MLNKRRFFTKNIPSPDLVLSPTTKKPSPPASFSFPWPWFIVSFLTHFKQVIFYMVSITKRVFILITLILLFIITKYISKSFYSFKRFPLVLEKPAWRTNQFLLSVYNRLVNILDPRTNTAISKSDLIELSFKNMQAKKIRTAVTVGGMAIGISAIIFLVSIGYGLEDLVISRVARLNELKQTEVTAQVDGKVKLDDSSLANIKELDNVTNVLPLIAVVGKVNYKGSISDMAVYGVTSNYLLESAIKPSRGRIFNSNSIVTHIPKSHTSMIDENMDISPPVRQATPGGMIQPVTFSLSASEWIRVREGPFLDSKVIGYTKSITTKQKGYEVWGDTYEGGVKPKISSGSASVISFGKWIKTTIPLWEKTACLITEGDCENGQYRVMRNENGKQTQQTGFLAELSNVSLADTFAQVLAASTSANVLLTDDSVRIASLEAEPDQVENKKIALSEDAIKEAVVNRAVLQVLNIHEDEAIGTTFATTFIVTSDLLPQSSQKVESLSSTYTIVGILPDDKTPIFYIPFIDLRSLGITNFSQAKIIVAGPSDLPVVRKKIAAMGFITSSVADTVEQIKGIFSTVRSVLTIIGLVALLIAGLGMFNTLTVSLLERTREVGLMKAMGMKSEEVQELFLIESMIMSIFGGIFGVLIGFVVGKFLGVILSVIALTNSVGGLNADQVLPPFIIFSSAFLFTYAAITKLIPVTKLLLTAGICITLLSLYWLITLVGFMDISKIPLLFVFFIIFLSLGVGIVTGIYPARRATKISALNALRYE